MLSRCVRGAIANGRVQVRRSFHSSRAAREAPKAAEEAAYSLDPSIVKANGAAIIAGIGVGLWFRGKSKYQTDLRDQNGAADAESLTHGQYLVHLLASWVQGDTWEKERDLFNEHLRTRQEAADLTHLVWHNHKSQGNMPTFAEGMKNRYVPDYNIPKDK